METLLLLLLLLALLFSFQKISFARDTISSTQFLKYGDTIVSSGGIFEMGFFSPINSQNIYVGIWYNHIPVRTVVWVANRDTPLSNTSSVALQIISPGWLALVDGNGADIWHTNTSRQVPNPVAKLLDSGNLVVIDANDDNPESFLWQSFDYPTDTHLPGMKLGKNFVTGLDTTLSAWKSESNPGMGEYKLCVDPAGCPQLILRKGRQKVSRWGPWNGLRWGGLAGMLKKTATAEMLVIMNTNEVSFSYNSSKLIRTVLSNDGSVEIYMWADGRREWNNIRKIPTDVCDEYKLCGAYESCDYNNNPVCGCLDKFLPRDPGAWGKGDYSGGCVQRTPLKCHNTSSDGFVKYSGVKLPDTEFSWFNSSMNLQECEQVCFNNCSCMAYSSLDISNGQNGCLLWFVDLVDIKVLPVDGQDLYIRMASSDLEPITKETHASLKGKKAKIVLGCLVPLTIMVLLGLCFGLYLYKKNKNKMMKLKEWLELPLFDLSTISRATNNFSENNKLGEGGFGAVYKGILDNKEEIAVKRLSKTSKQGVLEFKNEVICIAKLQHRNLVKLLGCCIQGEETLLVYEYMANKSLDTFIFDDAKNKLLDWPKRHSIINGIARGLMYLHQDSRLRVIHRDLKASNVLLDNNMNPKISDFGLARSVGGDVTEANASRIMGTHGYISPEYAANGIFSIKSDTFSFGVLLLEIVTGKRNRGFSHPDHCLNLIGYAWKLYKENRELELIDVHLILSCDLSQVQRCIHIGLLCVQQCPGDRPTMSSVVTMLTNDYTLPEAKEPGFFTERRVNTSDYSSSTQGISSRNECTITALDPR